MASLTYMDPVVPVVVLPVEGTAVNAFHLLIAKVDVKVVSLRHFLQLNARVVRELAVPGSPVWEGF